VNSVEPVPGDLAGRQEAVDRVLADPPVVHYMSYDDAAEGRLGGVWSTEESCYRFLAEHCPPGARSLETGSGISTILFAAWGAEHRCVTPGDVEAAAILAYCDRHQLPVEGVTFDLGASDTVLPRLDPEAPPLDLVLIDGCHGFPVPMIDWFYGAGRLRQGGVVVIDDIHLPAVRVLTNFLDRDPRWRSIQRTPKWMAYERGNEGPLTEEWLFQPFYSFGDQAQVAPWKRAELTARRLLSPVKRAVISKLGRTPTP
jgi:hypothetical protein